MPRVVHSSISRPSSRMPASAPRTKRCGSFAFCARALARSVGSVVNSTSTAGTATAKARRPVAAPAAAEPSVMVKIPRFSSTSPESLPTRAVPQAAKRAASSSGHALERNRPRESPASGRTSTVTSTTNPLLTQSMLATSGMVASAHGQQLRQGVCLAQETGTAARIGFKQSGAAFGVPGFPRFGADEEFLGTQRPGKVDVVGHRNDCRAAGQLLAQQHGKFPPGVCVLAEGRLVEDQDGRAGGQHRGHRQPPFFAARKGERVGLGKVFEPEPLQEFVDPLLDGSVVEERFPGPGFHGVPWPEGQFLADRGGHELVLGFLEDRTDAADQLGCAPVVGACLGAVGEVPGGQQAARGLGQEPAQGQRKRRLAGPVGPADAPGVAAGDSKVQVACGNRSALFPGDRQVLGLQQDGAVRPDRIDGPDRRANTRAPRRRPR